MNKVVNVSWFKKKIKYDCSRNVAASGPNDRNDMFAVAPLTAKTIKTSAFSMSKTLVTTNWIGNNFLNGIEVSKLNMYAIPKKWKDI